MTGTDSTSAAPVSYEKGTWQESLHKSATLLDRSTKARKQASNLLWTGAKTGISDWLGDSDADASGETLYNEVLDILGAPRKGDASKIKTVALAVRNNGLVLTDYANLSKAYAEATRLTKTVREQAEEDDAADEAVSAIEAPKTASTVESAALVVFSRGVDGAVVALLDALGADNEAAHRSFMRAVSTEIAARTQAKVANAKAAQAAVAKEKADQKAKEGAERAAAKPTKKAAAPKSGATKAKPAGVKAAPVKAKPVAAKAKPSAPVDEPVHVGDDTPDHTEAAEIAEAEANAVETPKVAAKPVRRAVPVRRG